MKRTILSFAVAMVLAHSGIAQTSTTSEATRLENAGKFTEAKALLSDAINSKTLSSADAKAFEYRIDRLHRIKNDYSLTKERLAADLKEELKDFSTTDFEKWIKDGWFDTREIDGTQLFVTDSVENLWFRHPELNSHRSKAPDKSVEDHSALERIIAIKKAAEAASSPYVLPKTFDVTMKVAVKPHVVPDGEIIRAWLPIPRRYAFQDNFKVLQVSWLPESINDAKSPIRAAYFEQPARHGLPTEFKIEYEYTMFGVHFDLKPEKIRPHSPDSMELKEYTAESPHVIFTPELRTLSAKIVGAETNPMLKAKKIFDWLADNLQYSYSLEYSTIPNISDYTRSHCYGDCGQQGMLFIALCRYNGVPARWQSGWDLTPGATSNHDWSEIFLAPYGWVPVDPYMGNHAMRYMTTLTPEQRIEVRDFYFGGLDQYRMVANSDHSIALSPAKKSVRSDDVDFQRGELEYAGKNIYLDQFKYSLHYKEIPSPALP